MAQENLNNNLIQPAKTLRGEDVVFSGGVSVIPNLQWGKGVMYYAGADSGDIYVRLVKDPKTKWTKFQLGGGDQQLMIFDRIRYEGTTVNMDSLIIFLTTN
jgi:hypothetical protein